MIYGTKVAETDFLHLLEQSLFVMQEKLTCAFEIELSFVILTYTSSQKVGQTFSFNGGSLFS